MTTIKDMVADTRRMAYGSMSEQINLLSQPYAASGGELFMELDVSGITSGMVLSGDLNVWYVKGIDPTSNSVLVIPGYDNSPTRSMDAGEFITIKPRVTDWYMFESLNQEILRLSTPEHGLYQIKSWTVDVDPTWQTYEIPTAAFDMIGLLRVRYRMPGSSDVWIDIPEKSYRVQITDAQGSSYIRLLRNVPSGTEVKFLYKAPFSQADNLSDSAITVCGLSETMVDIPTLGVLGTLLRTTESRRGQVQTQGDARRAGEVPAGSNMSIASRIERDHQMRIWEEAARLIQRVPIQRSM
ncbi:MAG: hypothetical protein KGN78_05690 [Actinomycetales bacterium]|nr:hypothetical protein [Actinomycetales bacterium]